MLDFINVLPDPLKWIDDTLCILRYGAGVKITWSSGTDWAGGDVEMLLRSYGVRVWNRQYARKKGVDDYGLHVRPQQARWAEYVLRKAGCPLTSPLISEANRHVQPGGAMPRAWGVPAKPVGFVGRMVDFLLR